MKETGNKEACCDPHKIINDFYEKILGYVIKKVNNAELAKDITQDVMGRLIDAYDKQVPVSNIKAWLFQVTRNILADRYRKKEILDFADISNDVPDEEERLISEEDFIIPMINLLPEEYRQPLYLSDIENLKQAEIAKRLHLSLSATKMRCQRGRKKLHELFSECCDIEYTESGAFAGCTIKSSCDTLLKVEENMKKKIE